MVTLAMGHLLPHEVSPSVTPYRHPAPKVTFDDHGQACDTTEVREMFVDMDLFEDMIAEGKFETKREAIAWVRDVYTLIYDKDDEATHWTKNTWRRIKMSMFPEVLAVFDALPQEIYSTRPEPGVDLRSAAQKLLDAGKCEKGHKIKGIEDLGSNGTDSQGRPRFGCIHCRRLRSRKKRARERANKKKGK